MNIAYISSALVISVMAESVTPTKTVGDQRTKRCKNSPLTNNNGKKFRKILPKFNTEDVVCSITFVRKRLFPDFTFNKNPVADHVFNEIGSKNPKVFIFICTYKPKSNTDL